MYQHISFLKLKVPQLERELLERPLQLRSPPVFSGVRVTRSLVFCVTSCGSLFSLLILFFLSVSYLPFFDLRLLQTFSLSFLTIIIFFKF
jgi:hypothetical protein